ncbi:restriction endonuclease subunit S [Sporosarcina jiandibaonis]|uniref:restriction endonuclease subunit S n=1 Tax=Sporosarcina jiandibaonis TaxID=2715535 RepID=UPI0015563D7A|nr:restriction endonuclease subunit S [Sporosarcina jiandibaonis]
MGFKLIDYALHEVLTIKYGKNQKKVLDEQGKYPILGTGGIMGYANQFLYDKPSVLIGRKGSIRKVRFIDRPFWTVDTLFYSEVNEEIVYPKFIYYYLSQIDFEHYNEGTTIPSLRTETLNRISISLPSKPDQRKILNTINPIEEKINVNEKIISNLEQLAQTLYKRWFVDFEFPNENGEPYKSSGGEMVDSELGKIPSNWEIKAIEELINVIDNRGKTPPQVKNNTKYPIIDVKGLSGTSRIIDFNNCLKHVNRETYENWFRNGHPEEYDILFSTVGSIGSIKLFYGKVGCIAQNVVALRSKNISPFYLYQYIDREQERIKTYDIGSVQPSIKITHFIKKKILIPSYNIEKEFHEVIETISHKIYSLTKEIRELGELRDTLLPKLLTGEIELPEEIEVTEDVPIS